MFRHPSFLFIVLLLMACERSIEFDAGTAEPLPVVEAVIESGQPPVVMLSTSLDFFGTITPELLANSFIRGADVRISNGTATHRLKEYEVELAAGFKYYYYGVDSAMLSTAFLGEFGGNYSLVIQHAGKTYTANTTIPLLSKTIDSLWWEPSPNNPDTTQVILMARTTDPPGLGNYIRYFTSTNGEPFYPGFASVFDDQIIDGKTYSIQVEKGVDRNREIDFETYSFFTKGDSVVVKLTNIDKATFDFWRTMEFSYSSIGNPFASPTKVLGNINGGALGYFGGYAVQLKAIRL